MQKKNAIQKEDAVKLLYLRTFFPSKKNAEGTLVVTRTLSELSCMQLVILAGFILRMLKNLLRSTA